MSIWNSLSARANKYPYLEAIALILVTGALFVSNIASVKFLGDESLWVGRSYFFELFFSGRFRDMVHDPSPSLSQTMPTIPEYLTGLSRWLGGYRPADLNPPTYAYEKTYQENVQEGKVPSPGLLWWSRLLPSLAGAASILLMFYLIKAARSRLAAYLWLLIALSSKFLASSLQTAMSEAPLMLSIMLACLAAYQTVRCANRQPPDVARGLVWVTLFGAFTGLAGQSKNNGLSLVVAGAVVVVVLAIAAGPTGAMRLKVLFGGLLAMSAAAFLFFVGPNPILWKHPIASSLALIPSRLDLMQRQMIAYPRAAIHTWHDWVSVVPYRMFSLVMPLSFPGSWYLSLLFVAVGLWTLVAQVIRSIRAGHPEPASLAILSVGAAAAIPTLFSPLSWARYFLIPVFFMAALFCIGLETMVIWAWGAWQRKGVRPEGTAASPPA